MQAGPYRVGRCSHPRYTHSCSEVRVCKSRCDELASVSYLSCNRTKHPDVVNPPVPEICSRKQQFHQCAALPPDSSLTSAEPASPVAADLQNTTSGTMARSSGSVAPSMPWQVVHQGQRVFSPHILLLSQPCNLWQHHALVASWQHLINTQHAAHSSPPGMLPPHAAMLRTQALPFSYHPGESPLNRFLIVQSSCNGALHAGDTRHLFLGLDVE